MFKRMSDKEVRCEIRNIAIYQLQSTVQHMTKVNLNDVTATFELHLADGSSIEFTINEDLRNWKEEKHILHVVQSKAKWL